MEPINTRSMSAAAAAYLGMEWPLALGHRYRPKQGCTCGRAECPIPGAHPRPDGNRLANDNLHSTLELLPGAGLIAFTERFDAVLVPRQVGMAAMVQLDREIPVVCLILDQHTYAMLVLPATGRYAAVDEQVEVRTGPEGWVAVPPSRGVRWDTPPWIEGTTEPRHLLHGDEIRPVLAECFKVVETRAVR